jgi:hypothetical protein
MNSEISIDYYVNYKNKLQEYLNKLNRQQLIELFDIIINYNPNIPHSKNKNGYFLDIKLLPNEIIQKLEEKCLEFMNSLEENSLEILDISINK